LDIYLFEVEDIEENTGPQPIISIQWSVPDPWYFGTDSDLRIHTSY